MAADEDAPVLNRYGDVQLPPGALARATGNDPSAAAAFLARLVASARRGVWLVLDWPSQAHLLPVAAAAGFSPHHARRGGGVTLAFWPPGGGPDPTPPYAHTDVGCGAVVVDGAGRVLVVRDAFDASGSVNVPGGHLDEGEGLLECAAREAREETGVRAAPLGVLALRGVHNADRLPPGAEGAAEGELSADARALRAAGRAGALGGGAPREYAYGGARASMEHRSRFGTAHLGVYVLCALADAEGAAVSADPAEVSSAEWLAPDAAVAGAHPYIALLLAAARDAGALDGAARVSALVAAGAPRADVDAARAAVPGLLRCVPCVETARVPPPRGAAQPGAAARPPAGERLGYPSRFYSAAPPAAWAAGAAAARAARTGAGGEDDVPTVVDGF